MAGALNVAELIAARAAAEPVRPALLHSGGTESYGELLARADMIAARLRPMLHGPAPRVALLCPNGPDYVALALAILRTGACLGPVAGELVVPERVAQLGLTAPQLMLAAGPEQWLPAPGVAEAIAGIRFSWCALDIAAAFSEHRFATLHPAFLRFSSGTTGDRKGVLLSHETLLARVRSANRRLGITSADRVLWTPDALGDKVIHPYSDFLLHDVGTGDGIPVSPAPEHAATTNMMRTAPLWGLRTRNRLMHDGLSFTKQEAIQRHEGQAAPVRDSYNALTDEQKGQVIEFLNSL